MIRVAIIGAGAAGCFCAVQLKRKLPHSEVSVYESGSKPLAKVAVTGGGRCNLTNTFQDVKSLAEVYPRGDRLMQRAFHVFDNRRLMLWFEGEGVRLTVQPDQCVFPQSQDAMQIVRTLQHGMEQAGVKLYLKHRVSRIEKTAVPAGATTEGYRITFADAALRPALADVVVVTTGGSPKPSGLEFLQSLQLKTEPPVPSLFSFNIAGTSPLMGIVADPVTVSLAGTRFRAQGALLFTHWGMSGPAILKLSSRAARHLAEAGYCAKLVVNWLNDATEADVRNSLILMQQQQPAKQIGNTHLPQLSSRLWQALLVRAGLRDAQKWSEVGVKQLNRLVAVLSADTYAVEGQSRHKEEFVTCGGVSLSNLNLNTLEAKTSPGLYLAGEVLDVDAVTGGFNLQAAWSMAYVVADSIVSRYGAGAD